MYKSIILLVTLLVTIVIVNGIHIDVDIDYHSPGANKDLKLMFESWRHQHGKSYTNAKEYMIRFTNFKDNHKSIQELNRVHQGKATFNHNKFSDLSKEEFSKMYLGYKPDPSAKRTHQIVRPNPVQYVGDNVPLLKVDWRQHGLVTPVKNQGACGSCWAFSATEGCETAWLKAGNSEQILSEQQIVDCDTTDGGCGGGDIITAFEYVISAGGLTSEADYPYIANDGTCQSDPAVATISNYIQAATPGNDTELALTIASEGPVSICVDASSWMSYSSGVITKNCGIDLDHCVQVVGLDVDTNTTTPIPYFIVRNSWGADWGEAGYIMIEAGKDLCGVSQEAYYPIV